MVNNKFEAFKLKRIIKQSGVKATVKRNEKNEFGEYVGEEKIVATFDCLFHHYKQFVSRQVSDSTISKSVSRPMVMCLLEDIAGIDFKEHDTVTLSANESITYEIVDINDIQGWGIIADISLREVDDGDVW